MSHECGVPLCPGGRKAVTGQGNVRCSVELIEQQVKSLAVCHWQVLPRYVTMSLLFGGFVQRIEGLKEETEGGERRANTVMPCV